MKQKNQNINAWPKAIETITLFVDDLDVARDFYQRAFGLPVWYEDNDSIVFKFGYTLINLLKSTEAAELVAPARVGNRESGARFVFTLDVEDVDAMCVELVARGVTLLNGPMDRPWGVRTASFADPDGYIWEIAL